MSQLMKKFMLLLSCAVFVASCSLEGDTREEVISRFPGGEKKIVAKYQGHGEKEQMVERLTYDKSGTLVLREDLRSGVSKNWGDLNPKIKKAPELRKYLQGTWVAVTVEDKGEYTEHFEKMTFTFKGEVVDLVREGKFTNLGKLSTIKKRLKATYLDDGFVLFASENQDNKKKNEAPQKVKIRIKSKTSFDFDSPEMQLSFQKT